MQMKLVQYIMPKTLPLEKPGLQIRSFFHGSRLRIHKLSMPITLSSMNVRINWICRTKALTVVHPLHANMSARKPWRNVFSQAYAAFRCRL